VSSAVGRHPRWTWTLVTPPTDPFIVAAVGWEGETLVVETTNFTDRVWSFSTTFESWGTGENVRLTERFTRVGADTLQYEFTVDDPAVFSRTFTGRFPLNLSDLPLYEYACHEGNYGLYNILNGARADEQTEEQGDTACDVRSLRSGGVCDWS